MIESVGASVDGTQDELYRDLVELAPDGILVHDGDRVVLANAAALRLVGATEAGQLVGQPIEIFFDPPFLKAIQRLLTGGPGSAEASPPIPDTLHRLDGSNLSVVVREVPFLDHGRPSAHLVIRDITERIAMVEATRRMEERLNQAQRMETVGALAGGVAHEVNNMMAVILGFSDALLLEAVLPPGCVADVHEIMKAADRAAAVTRQLLTFSRRAIHRPQVLDLAAAVREAAPMVRRLLGEGRRLVIIAEAEVRVCLDPGQIRQVIVNLTLNARDAMPGDGILTITVRQTTLPAEATNCDNAEIPPGQYATLQVSDTGSGISEAVRARIFEPFFTTKPVGEGTGLGLSAVHGIVTQSSGHIAVCDNAGRGTTFSIYFPLLPFGDLVRRRGASSPAGKNPAYAGATVLLVEDEEALRTVCARMLDRAGFQVLQATDGAQALELINRHGPPQVVLTDLTMPVMGGAELARCLRVRWPLMPVVFMSGYTADELRRLGVFDSEGDIVLKPFTPPELVAGVVRALSRAVPAIPALP